jgi:hypothetical protein
MLAHRDKVPGVTPGSFRRQPFGNSVMGRCLLTLLTSAGGAPLAVATAHLESPCPPDGMYTAERARQMREALRVLDAAPAGNVLFAGGRAQPLAARGRLAAPRVLARGLLHT